MTVTATAAVIRRCSVWATAFGIREWRSIFFGQHDVPLPQDYDGDGRADLGVYRPAHGRWLVLLSTTAYQQYLNIQWGTTGDVPIGGPRIAEGVP
jgi:hypothetical protein